MFKKLIVLIVLSVICFGAQAQSIKILKAGNNGIVVRGNTGGILKWYWLGVSYKIGDGQETDLKSGIFRCKGSINKTFNANSIFSLTGKDKGKTITWYAKLWKKKVKKNSCTRGTCRWCMFNGYHFEGQVASASGTTTFE